MAKVSFKRSESWRTQGHKTSVTEVLLDGKTAGSIEATEPIAYGGMGRYDIYVAGYRNSANSLLEAKQLTRSVFEKE